MVTGVTKSEWRRISLSLSNSEKLGIEHWLRENGYSFRMSPLDDGKIRVVDDSLNLICHGTPAFIAGYVQSLIDMRSSMNLPLADAAADLLKRLPDKDD